MLRLNMLDQSWEGGRNSPAEIASSWGKLVVVPFDVVHHRFLSGASVLLPRTPVNIAEIMALWDGSNLAEIADGYDFA